ncbi:MAG: sugar phosphate isomerase/epimerase, partial [Acidobacteria bacterium]|nr:sugar phosphate isomerase/epimerase [Acidobacteriota bacterium]
MKLGVFTALFGGLTLDQVIEKVTAAGLDAIEIGTGAYPGSAHIDVEGLLGNRGKVKVYRQKIADAGLTISALSCHGNPLHPDKAFAKNHDEIFRRTVRLAELLEVGVVITFSGCPGDSDGSQQPNWVTCPWPPDYLKVLEWQWDKKVIPYWTRAGKFAKEHGIRVALEAHPGFVVYNVETALKLRDAAGTQIGVNFDPSHLFWQGV